MKKQFEKAVHASSEVRALFVLLVIMALRVWRFIPTLRPQHLLVPASLLQMIVFVIAALNPHKFISIASIGFFIVVGFALIPSTFQRPKSTPTVHWVQRS